MARLALATCRDLADLIDDERLLVQDLAAHGVEAVPAVWDDPSVDWRSFDAVLIRTTWDYSARHDAFLAWFAQLEGMGVTVWNSLPMMRWNLDKRYLFRFAGQGVPLLPTRHVPRGDTESLASILDADGIQDAVVKPVVSAGAARTWRVSRREAVAREALYRREVELSDLLVQAYAPEIVSEGEWSLLYFDGEFSHALVKHPGSGDFRVQEKHGGWYDVRQPSTDLIEQGARILSLLEETPVYARVDGIVRDGRLHLMELELLEPQLFLALVPEASKRLAGLLAGKLAGREVAV